MSSSVPGRPCSPKVAPDGKIVIPDGPGLGCDLVWEKVVKHPYQVSNFLTLFAQGWERREGARTPPSPDLAAIPAADQDAKSV